MHLTNKADGTATLYKYKHRQNVAVRLKSCKLSTLQKRFSYGIQSRYSDGKHLYGVTGENNMTDEGDTGE